MKPKVCSACGQVIPQQLCLHRQWVWPFKSCTRPQGHEGEHCEERRAGTVMIETWWRREP